MNDQTRAERSRDMLLSLKYLLIRHSCFTRAACIARRCVVALVMLLRKVENRTIDKTRTALANRRSNALDGTMSTDPSVECAIAQCRASKYLYVSESVSWT
mmetsp:Transcript_11548/g.19765  ORF Transcript_11548/g.19765 Transcript_11548/m.19765 type:complete len:101 (-) Transcript_11548:106-408(-)